MEIEAQTGRAKSIGRDEFRRSRRLKALELRQAGLSYPQIAKAIEVKGGAGAAYRIVQNALKATYREPADEVRKLELERLDRLTLGIWGKAKEGDLDSIDRVLKLMDRRAKLIGLDAPTKTEAKVVMADDDADIPAAQFDHWARERVRCGIDGTPRAQLETDWPANRAIESSGLREPDRDSGVEPSGSPESTE